MRGVTPGSHYPGPMASSDHPTHPGEPHVPGLAQRLSWVRAGVLGANDGIVSTAGLVVGVAGATSARSSLLVAGVAGLVAGAASMAAGEYVSVSTQRDSEQALLEKERRELAEEPEEELAELAGLYVARGLTPDLAHDVAVQLTAHDALGAHAEVELGLDPERLTSPVAASVASMLSFTVGALLPLLTILVAPAGLRVPLTVAAVAAALALTGWASAVLAASPRGRAVARNVAGGVLAMLVTYLVGTLVGARL